MTARMRDGVQRLRLLLPDDLYSWGKYVGKRYKKL